MKVILRVIICLTACVMLCSCSTSQNIANGNLSCDNVIASGKYYSISGSDSTRITYYIYDKDGNTVFSETTDRPIKINMINDIIVDVAMGMGTGISTHKYYNVNDNAFSKTFSSVIASFDGLVAYIDVDDKNPLESRTVVIQDIFNDDLFYKSFKLDFSLVDTPVVKAEFSDDGAILTVTYLSGDNQLEKIAILNCK